MKIEPEIELILRDLMKRLNIYETGKAIKCFYRICFDFSDTDTIVREKPLEEIDPEDDEPLYCFCGNNATKYIASNYMHSYLLDSFDFCCDNQDCLEKIAHSHHVMCDVHETKKYQQLLERAIKWSQK